VAWDYTRKITVLALRDPGSEALQEILRGSADAVTEAGTVVVDGHAINDGADVRARCQQSRGPGEIDNAGQDGNLLFHVSPLYQHTSSIGSQLIKVK
jgi:hypothetical protein